MSVPSEQFVHHLAKCQRPVFGYILSLVPNWADAEDILQETSSRLWEKREQWQPEKDFCAWACTVAHYLVLAYRKKKRREKVVFSEESFSAVAEQLTAEMKAVDPDARLHALMHCVARLSGSSRQLLALVYDTRLPIAQVATQFGRSTAATYQTLSRLRKSLYECVGRSLQVQEQE